MNAVSAKQVRAFHDLSSLLGCSVRRACFGGSLQLCIYHFDALRLEQGALVLLVLLQRVHQHVVDVLADIHACDCLLFPRDASERGAHHLHRISVLGLPPPQPSMTAQQQHRSIAGPRSIMRSGTTRLVRYSSWHKTISSMHKAGDIVYLAKTLETKAQHKKALPWARTRLPPL